MQKLAHRRRARAAPDLGRLFDASPNPYLVLDRDLHIATANTAYLASVKRELHDIVGRWAWDAFPTDPETEAQAVASFERVIATKQTDVMALLRFDTPRPAAEGGGFDEHYWTITHTPVLDETGEVAFVLQHPIEVTELKQLRDAAVAAGVPAVPDLHPAQTGIFGRAQQVYEANLALKAESERLEEMFRQAPSFMAMLRGPEHVFEFANPAYVRLMGGREVVGRPIREALPEAVDQGYVDLLDRVYASGEAFSSSRARYAFQAEPGVPVVEIFADFVFQPVRDADGRVGGIFVDGSDVTLQVANERVLEHAKQAAEEAARHATTMAMTDQLTGLANRRNTLRRLDEAMAMARLAGRAVSVALFDVDRFKRVNDAWGHAVGDEVLRRVARDAAGALGGEDVVGRVGGEEFLLVLPGADRTKAMATAERVRLAIQARGGAVDAGPAVSASFGVATWSGEDAADLLLQRADRALYEAKRSGRNTLRYAA